MPSRITDRDFDLLIYLAAQGVATLDQLTERFFPSRVTCRTRLLVLRRAGLIESIPLTQLKSVSFGAYNKATDILSLPNQDTWKYRVYRLTERLRSNRAGADGFSEPKMWRHQIQLNGIRNRIAKWFPDATILTDPDIQAEERRFKMGKGLPIPDLVVRTGNHQVAIELERCEKGEMKYYFRFIEYQGSPYSHVLYFCENERLFNKISDYAAGIEKIGVSRLLAPNLVYQKYSGFVEIEEFLSRPTQGGKNA